jgi:N,N'-diacetyllegionaminate synthase
MKTFIIAEIAQAHEGSLGILHSYIDALATTGVDAVKFQTHIADAESSVHEPFRVKFSFVDQTRFDYWKRMEFTAEQWAGIKKHCEDRNLEFISSPFSIKAVDLLEELNVKRYKVASGEITNFLLLEKIARTGKPVILSSGMSDLGELEGAINYFRERSIPTSVLQCTTMYPTPAEKLGLNVIPVLREKFKCPVGFSDHSGQITACLAAKALGAEILEFHAVFDRRMFGPDATSSLTIDEIASLVDKVRYLDRAFASPIDKNDTRTYDENKKIFGKTLAVNQDLTKGHVMRFEDLESKKPAGHGIPASEFVKVLGRRLNKDLMKYSFLTDNDLEQE